MPCPSSGQISIQSLVDEFGGTAPHAMSEYYRNGDLVPGNNTSIPESGEFKLSNCYSAVNEIIHTHSSDATNQNYATVFGDNWTSTVPKRIVINSGVTVGATAGSHAMNIPSGMGGTLIIDNNGNVHGHGGTSNGGTGGDAIHCASTAVTINNNSGATIKAGGGGGGLGGIGGTGGSGGQGGTGGGGRYTQYHGGACPTSSYCTNTYGSWVTGYTQYWDKCKCVYGISWGYYGGTSWICDQGYWATIGTYCYEYHNTTGGAGGAGSTSGGAGGAGGAGGVGQGYNQSAGSGSAGSAGAAGGSGSSGASGGTNAGTGGTGGSGGQGGTGGTGGDGGAFGAAGSAGATGATGNTGATGATGANGNISNGSAGSSGSGGSGGSAGSSGGSAGYYIYNRASITLNNSGTVAGN